MKKLTILLTSVALLLSTSLVWADDHEPEETDDVAVLWHIDVKAGQSDAFENAIREFNDFMADKEGRWHWEWYSVLSGPHTGTYYARSGNHNYADLDVDQPWDAEVDAYIDTNIAPFFDSATRTITVGDKDVHHWPEDWEGYKYFRIENWYVKNGKGAAFNAGLKKIHETLVAGDFPNHYGFSYPVTGANANQVNLVITYKSWADMAPKEPSFADIMKEAMGKEEFGTFMSDWASTYKAGDVTTVVMRMDMMGGTEQE